MERQKNRLERAVILRDKARFILHFHDLLGRQAWSWEALLRQEITSPPPQRLVIKNRWGVKGHDIHFPATRFADWAAVRSYIQSHLAPPEHYICEEYVDQHPDLSDLNPGTLNTLRIMTWQEAGEVAIWGTILRVGRGSGPDNWACGGLGTWVDEAGTLVGPSVPKNPFLVKVDRHPDSGRPIKGRRVPDIEAARRLAVESALRLPEVQSVGWDIAIGVRGPCLIEGNDRWSHQLWQCVLDQGRREMANRVCDMYQVYE